MSAIEIPNAIHAAGTFAVEVGAPGQFADHIPSSVGFRPFDPAGTPLAPKGGFTKLGTGQYVMQLVEPIDPLEGMLVTSIFIPADNIVVKQSAIIPTFAPFNPDSNFVGVLTMDSPTGDADDADVYQSFVLRYATGPRMVDNVVP